MCGYCTLNGKPARKGFSSWLTQPRWVAYHLTEEKCLAKKMKVVVLSKAWKRNCVVPIRELALLVMPLFRFVGVVSRDVSNQLLKLLLHPLWWLDSHKHWPKLQHRTVPAWRRLFWTVARLFHRATCPFRTVVQGKERTTNLTGTIRQSNETICNARSTNHWQNFLDSMPVPHGCLLLA